MNGTDSLSLSLNLIDKPFQIKKGFLEESKEKMKIPIDDRGLKYLVYSFDRNLDSKNYPKGLFPFFNRSTKKAHSVCDYMIWTQKDGKTYIILVELKHGEESAGPQLRAGKNLANFIVATLNQINGKNIKPIIRMVSIHNARIQKKGNVRMKPVEYNTEGFASFKGNAFCVIDFLC